MQRQIKNIIKFFFPLTSQYISRLTSCFDVTLSLWCVECWALNVQKCTFEETCFVLSFCLKQESIQYLLSAKEELEMLKERGVTQIDLIVSDTLQGIENVVCQLSLSHLISSAQLILSNKYLIAPLIKINRRWQKNLMRSLLWKTKR